MALDRSREGAHHRTHAMKLLPTSLLRVRDLYRARHEPENMRQLAEWYWHVLLSCAFVAVGCILIFGVLRFVQVFEALNPDSLTKASRPSVLDRSLLNEVIGEVGKRQATFDELLVRPPIIPDPL